MNENTVVIVSGQTSGTYLKLAEELQNVLDRRDTNELRILPVVGTPGPQNILDVVSSSCWASRSRRSISINL